MKNLILRALVLSLALSTPLLSQEAQKPAQSIILWESLSAKDPSFNSKAQAEFLRQFQSIPGYHFTDQDTLQAIAESKLYTWPIESQVLRDSIAQILDANFQMEFSTGTLQKKTERSVFYVTAEEYISYGLELKVLFSDSLLYHGKIEVDTLIDHGWCGFTQCKVKQAPVTEELNIKQNLLKKGIRYILQDLQTALPPGK